MLSFGPSNHSEMYQGKHQRSNHQYRGLFSACKRLVSLAAFCVLADRSATNVVNYVNAVKTDKVSFQIFEIDGALQDIMWCGNTNEVILVQTDAGTIYRSRDRGDSWKKLHSYMHQTGMNVVDDGQTVSTTRERGIPFARLGFLPRVRAQARSARRPGRQRCSKFHFEPRSCAILRIFRGVFIFNRW
jgi:hypothetical protein